MCHHSLLKLSFMMHCDFDTGSLKVNIFKVLFWDECGSRTKKYSLYTCDNPDNSERPVSSYELTSVPDLPVVCLRG